MTKNRLAAVLTFMIVLCMSVCLAGFDDKAVFGAEKTVTLNVSLYKVLPDYDSFEKAVEECWKEKHPEVKLIFSDWDCYSGVAPDDLDVFVFDTTSLDTFAKKGYLLNLSREEIRDYEDLIPSFLEGSRVNEDIYAVPQLLCTDLLYTRKDDEDLREVQNIKELHDALGSSGLLMDKEEAAIKVVMYLQALVDEKQQYTDCYPPIEEGKLSSETIESLELIRDMHQSDDEDVPEDSGLYYSAGRFAEGMGRAYIGYSETLDVMGESASDMDFRLFSMTDDPDIPVFYVDAAAVNSKVSDEKKELALDFLNMITGKDLMVRALANGGNPKYLLAARYSIYDTLASDYPIYGDLKKIASVPNACVFRIKPDGDAYLAEAEKNADLLPSFSE